MSKKIKLLHYRIVLFKYRLSSIFPFLKVFLKTDLGFCYYFSPKNLSYYPELHRLKEESNFKEYKPYWFKEGDVDSRIVLLKKAIKLCKNN